MQILQTGYTLLGLQGVWKDNRCRKICKQFAQTWKMSEILPKQNCSFSDFTRKCVNYVKFRIATKQRNLSANTKFTTFTSCLFNNYKKNTT